MRWTAGVAALVLAWVSVGCSEVGPRIRPGTLSTAQRELDLAAEAGLPARLLAADHFEDLASVLAKARRETAEEVTLIAVSPHDYGVDFGAPLQTPTISRLERLQIESQLEEWVRRFLRMGDVDGAVRAAARGYTLALRAQGLLAPGPPLPPFNPPNPRSRAAAPATTYHWGAPLSLAVFGLGLGLLVRERATGRA